MNYPVGMGTTQLAESYGGILGLPVTFLIGRDGHIAAKYVGLTGHRNNSAEGRVAAAEEVTRRYSLASFAKVLLEEFRERALVALVHGGSHRIASPIRCWHSLDSAISMSPAVRRSSTFAAANTDTRWPPPGVTPPARRLTSLRRVVSTVRLPFVLQRGQARQAVATVPAPRSPLPQSRHRLRPCTSRRTAATRSGAAANKPEKHSLIISGSSSPVSTFSRSNSVPASPPFAGQRSNCSQPGRRLGIRQAGPRRPQSRPGYGCEAGLGRTSRATLPQCRPEVRTRLPSARAECPQVDIRLGVIQFVERADDLGDGRTALVEFCGIDPSTDRRPRQDPAIKARQVQLANNLGGLCNHQVGAILEVSAKLRRRPRSDELAHTQLADRVQRLLDGIGLAHTST